MGAAARQLADSIDAREMSQRVFDRIVREVFPSRAQDEEFLAALDDSVHDNVQAVLGVIAGRLRISSAEPLGAIALMDVLTRLGEPTSAVERGYRIGQWEIWEQWVVAATRVADGDDALLVELLVEPVRTLFDYIDSILMTVLERYEEHRRELDRERTHQRMLMLRQVLDGSHEPPAAAVTATLHYDCLLTHRAVVLAAADRSTAERALERLRVALDASGALLYQESVGGWALWLGRTAAASPRRLRALRHELAGLGLQAGVSEPAAGIAGLRETLHQARQALRIGQALEATTTWFADVQLEALLLDEDARATGFVRSVLGPLAGDDERSARLRETIAAWLETGSHVSAAAALGIHEHTVRNRLRQVEELLDAQLLQRRTELAVALRLQRVLG
ncbi:CdaR family transcriptional regulator [Conexibacter sp. SYSU D00693]|uniref:PucR family transcriptional regulator n=1 Tax=Conexibacter sp. SYSU D00693 TaxID=2812560 RepID=UPI00196AAB5C|nr:helix-turn-helix domain-containing protein [Conexibacter sp. SYSU D00693]